MLGFLIALLMLFQEPSGPGIKFYVVGGMLGEPIIAEEFIVYSDEEFLMPSDLGLKMLDLHAGCEYFDLYLVEDKKYIPFGKWRKKNDEWVVKESHSSRWYPIALKKEPQAEQAF